MQRMGLRTRFPSAMYLSNVSDTLPPVAPRADSLRYSRFQFPLVAVSATAVQSRLIVISQCPAEIGRLGFVLVRLITLSEAASNWVGFVKGLNKENALCFLFQQNAPF
jgi:hypothetical protein